MVDMAVGIIIGGAIGTVVKSLVSDVIMPPIGMLLGGIKFADWKIPLKAAEGDAEAVAINVGTFIDNCIAFLIVAFAVFMLVKMMNSMRKQEEEAPAEPPASETYLKEIRDALVQNKG